MFGIDSFFTRSDFMIENSLLEQIRKINADAASKLEITRFCSDEKIKSLNKHDLEDLFPGDDNFIARKQVRDVIHSKQKPNEALLRDLKGLIPDEHFRGPLSGTGPLLDYIWELKKYKIELAQLLEFFDAHIDLLEGLRTKHAEKQNEDPSVDGGMSSVNDPAPVEAVASPVGSSIISAIVTDIFSKIPYFNRGANDSSDQVQISTLNTGQVQNDVTYMKFVCGNTLGRHVDVLKKLNGPVPGPEPVSLHLKETQHEKESQVTIVFCPVVSRVGTDVKAALRDITSDKPLILVVMHHMHTPTGLPAPGSNSIVSFGVNVFFHESSGLLNCTENTEAINELKLKLLEYSTKKSCKN